jgi:DNA helicase-2/ATP-dependent DNA helicase PcrA
MSLDIAQQAVVNATIEANILVQAGPGRGKTHVLVSRIAQLVDSGSCSPGELLVLSFSRAARDELKRRIGLLPENSMAEAVMIRTLDSFASFVLQQASGETEGTYDERVLRAIRDLEDDPDACGVTQYKHVLVDEAQDIIGSRADMLLTLFKQMPQAGFTIFADSAQAIYDFNLLDQDALTTSQEMLNVFECRTEPSEVQIHRLQNYYRSSDPELIELCSIPWVSLIDYQYEKAKVGLDAALNRSKSCGSLAKLNWPTLDSGQTRAVVCPNNGQVLISASRAILAGENVVIAKGERDWAHPAWVGGLLFGKAQPTEITKELLAGELSSRLPIGVPPEEVHRALRRACFTGRNNPKVRDVVSALNQAQPFDSLSLPDHSSKPIVFSTIHRSKGREFDEVAYVDYIPREGSKEPTPGYNQRMRFVGLSRAKLRNFRVSQQNTNMLIKSKSSDRWAECQFISAGRLGIKAFEVGVQGDVDPASFVRFSSVGETALAQSTMLLLCKRGEIIDLVLGPSREQGSSPIYSMMHRASGQKVGEMSSWFTKDLQATRQSVQGWGRDFAPPMRLEGCWVRGIYTATPGDCESMEGIAPEVAASLLWCYVEIEGLAKAIWSQTV